MSFFVQYIVYAMVRKIVNATRLMSDDIKEIRQYYKTGEYKVLALARMFRVGTRRIVNIVNHKDSELGGWTDRERKNISGGKTQLQKEVTSTVTDFSKIKVYEDDDTEYSDSESEAPTPAPAPAPAPAPPQKQKDIPLDMDLHLLLEQVIEEQEEIKESRRRRLQDKFKSITA